MLLWIAFRILIFTPCFRKKENRSGQAQKKRKAPMTDAEKSQRKRDKKTAEQKKVIKEDEAQRQRVSRLPKAIKSK